MRALAADRWSCQTSADPAATTAAGIISASPGHSPMARRATSAAAASAATASDRSGRAGSAGSSRSGSESSQRDGVGDHAHAAGEPEQHEGQAQDVAVGLEPASESTSHSRDQAIATAPVEAQADEGGPRANLEMVHQARWCHD